MAVVVITGCSSGFGLETALAFARKGDTTVATMRDLAKAEALQKRAADDGLTIELETLDVCDDASVEACLQTVIDRHGRIDVVVNNAGIGSHGAVETIPIEHFRAIFETNFWGSVRMMRAALPHMRQQRSGTIVNVGSISGVLPGTLYNGPYGASKHALAVISEAVAGEAGPFGVRVVVIEPGFFATEISNNADGRQTGIEGTEYEADADWFERFMNSSVDGGADPSIVAERIVAAAHDPEPPLHQPVGDDADLYIALLGQSEGFEGWMENAVPVVEAQVGPRPAPPS